MIKNLTTGATYTDATEAARALGVTKRHVHNCLNGYYVHINGNRLRTMKPPIKSKICTRPDLAKPVRCIDNGRTYTSQASAARGARVPEEVMSRHLNRIGHRLINGMMYEYVHKRDRPEPPTPKGLERCNTRDLFR